MPIKQFSSISCREMLHVDAMVMKMMSALH